MLVSRSCQMRRPVHQSPFRVENRHSPETPRAPGESHRPIDRSPGRVGASLPRRPVRGVPGALPVCVWALALTCRGAFLHADVAFGARLAVAGHLACLLLLAAGAAPAVGILSGSPCGRRYLSLGWTRGGSAGSQGRCVSPWISRSRTSLRCAGRLPRQQGAVVAAPRASRSPGSPAERGGGGARRRGLRCHCRGGRRGSDPRGPCRALRHRAPGLPRAGPRALAAVSCRLFSPRP